MSGASWVVTCWSEKWLSDPTNVGILFRHFFVCLSFLLIKLCGGKRLHDEPRSICIWGYGAIYLMYNIQHLPANFCNIIGQLEFFIISCLMMKCLCCMALYLTSQFFIIVRLLLFWCLQKKWPSIVMHNTRQLHCWRNRTTSRRNRLQGIPSDCG